MPRAHREMPDDELMLAYAGGDADAFDVLYQRHEAGLYRFVRFDGVGIDEQVAYEFAKVRHLYQAQLKIGDRCEIEWFVGPHTINGVKTYEFLDKWLKQARP